MKLSKKAIIIGAGVGGMATAARLSSRGYEVKVFEKEHQVGGKVNRREAGEFKFDLTASILMMPQSYKELFSFIGKNYEDYLEFIKLDPIYRVHYYDGSTYDFSSDFIKMADTLESISKKDSSGYLRLLADSYEKYLVSDKYFLRKRFVDFSNFFNPVTIMKALQVKTLSTTYDYVSKYINNEKLRMFLCFQSMYVGISPYNGPNVYSLVPAVSQIYGLWQLKGGMYSYIKALEKVIHESGGTVETNVNVEEILFSRGRAVGVRTSKGIEKGDIVVSNADFSYSMKELIKYEKAKGKYTDEKISRMKYSCSTYVIYLGLKKKYPALSVHNLYLGNDFKKNIELPFQGSLPEEPSIYLYCPSRVDESMAPDGGECLNIMVRVPNLLSDEVKWNENTGNFLRKRVFDILRKITGLEDMEENIICESCLTPEDLQADFNSYAGAAFGISQTLTQTNYFRPHIKSPKIKNLYFVGDSVHPGTGVSIVLQSSKLVAEQIIKDEQ